MDDLKLPSDVLADRTTSERRFFDQGPAQEVIDFVVGNALRRAHPQFIEHSRHRRRPGGALDRQPLSRDVADFAGKQQLAIGKGQADGLMVEINARLATESATDFPPKGLGYWLAPHSRQSGRSRLASTTSPVRGSADASGAEAPP